MKAIHAIASLAISCLLNSCSTTLVARNNQAVITIPEGIVNQIPEPGQSLEWSGEKNEAGFAHGPGTETWFGLDGNKIRETELTYQSGTKNGPFTMREFSHGKLTYEGTGTYVNNVLVGEYKRRWFQLDGPTNVVYEEGTSNAQGLKHGQVTQRCLNGEKSISYYHHGTLTSSTTYNRDGTVKPPPVSRTASYSTSDDNDLLGAMVAITGAAAGSADLTMSGVSMVAGDEQGAMQHLQNAASTAAGGSATTSSGVPAGAGVPRSISSQSRNVITEGNLVDKYGLGRYRKDHDHISHYLATADEAYARYKQTGDSTYYDQHREYADLAKEVHQKTATQGTKISR
jgi:hypothetical protein